MMVEPTWAFPSKQDAEHAQLAPHRVRLLAFVLDLWLLIPIAVAGGLVSLARQFFGDFGVSTRTLLVLASAVLIGLGVMNATLVWLTQGQTMGKAHFGLVERRRANGLEVGAAAGLTRLIARHTVGYLVIDVLGLGGLAAFRLARRRCLHDVIFDTEVIQITDQATPRERRKALETRRLEALERIREAWGWQYDFVRWASKIVMVVVGGVITFFTSVGLLSAKASAASGAPLTSVPVASGPSTIGLVGLAAVTTSATFGVSMWELSEPSPKKPALTVTWATDVEDMRGQTGREVVLICPPEGTPQAVWGVDVYTDDSSVCTAAVHAGRISFKGGGRVTIELLPGRSEYASSTRNGVTTAWWPSWVGSFQFVEP